VQIHGGHANGNESYGILLDDNTDYTHITNFGTNSNVTACVRVNNANCNRNVLTNNFFDEGNISDAGTNTRAWLNYDPSANVFIVAINPPVTTGVGAEPLP